MTYSDEKSAKNSKIGYLAPYLANDFLEYSKKTGKNRQDLCREMGFTRPSIDRNLSCATSPDIKFLGHYAIATGKDIREFFKEIGLIVYLESLGIPVFDKLEEKLKRQKEEEEASKKARREKKKRKSSRSNEPQPPGTNPDENS